MKSGPKTLGWIVAAALGVGASACGDDKKKKEDPKDQAPGAEEAYTFFYRGGDVTFVDSDVGKTFVLMPFQLSDPRTTPGGTDQKVVIKGTSVSSSSLTTSDVGGWARASEPQFLVDEPWSFNLLDHSLRTLVNRFDPERGVDQDAWFWDLARNVDRAMGRSFGWQPFDLWEGALDGNEGPVTAYFRQAGTSPRRSFRYLELTTLTNACPSTDVVMPDVQDPIEADTAVISSVSNVVDGGDFCLVYLDDPKTESSKDAIKSTVTQVMKTYKEVIYKDALPVTTSGFVFKPTIVIVDFSSSKWPQALQITGAYSGPMSKEANRPMFYMASDVTKVGTNRGKTFSSDDLDLFKRQWHGTIAHEMQHAIIDYYRTKKTSGLSETPAVDEGLAHYMEDLFGYGEENFKDFAKKYLDIWSDTNPPILHATASEAVDRGGAWILWYYMISQKGGVTMTNGQVSGGPGLELVRKVVTDATKQGPNNLSTHIGKDWTEVVGGLFGAIAVNGSTAPQILGEFKMQEPEPVKDLTGSTSKKYGMKLNNFGGLGAQRNFGESVFKSGVVAGEVSFYATAPLQYEVKSAAEKLKFTSSSDAPNFAVVKVRIK